MIAEAGDLIRAQRKLDEMREAANKRYHTMVACGHENAGEIHRMKFREINRMERELRRVQKHELTPAQAGRGFSLNGSCNWGAGASGAKPQAVAGRMAFEEEIAAVMAVVEKSVPRGEEVYVHGVGSVRLRTKEEGRVETSLVVEWWAAEDARKALLLREL